MIFLKKIHENMIFSVYLVKMLFLFPLYTMLSFCRKSKDVFSPKNILEDDIFGIIEKIKDDKRIYSVKYA